MPFGSLLLQFLHDVPLAFLIFGLIPGQVVLNGTFAALTAELAEKRNGKTASRRDVYQAAAKLVRDGGAASLLARGETQKAVVVPVTEKANVHFSG